MLSKYDILLFDSDNTLYDHSIHEKAALNSAFSSVGEVLTPEELAVYTKINDDIWKEFEKGVKHEKGPLVERFVRFFDAVGKNISPVLINELYVEALGNQCSPFPDSFEVCKVLSKRYTLYIITNGTESVQIKRYNSSPLRPFFSGIFTASAIGAQKPTAEYFDRVFEKLGNPPRGRAVVIGDSLSSDILGGINAGVDTCWYNPSGKENTSDVRPTYEIKSLRELL